ncbi:hypothetical protein LPUS_09436 [Lasallia pustulata]|uniref:RFX1-4/6/8-like BCD domain-containing protein n=1 Tax=Lasallia pustulata TaxID=136370 RepID=A0A1W5D7Z3_9LECA|nr:hypothetical protein LPUS_09436 [Lasallia pustulata]
MAGLYLDQSAHTFTHSPTHPQIIKHELKFPTSEDPLYQEDEPIDLPSIHSYVPVGVDRDVADALTALYRSHCVSVVDCFRFCKEKMFWHHFTSFHGTLTVPVQKLLAHPSIAAWITECDWLMYQKMIRFVAPLALQVVPVRVLNTFRAISTRLTSHISTTFQNHPQHVRDAKQSPATIFAGLLDRLLRVNASAHAAANLLTNDENRDKMWYDWVAHVKPTKAVECTLPPSSRIFSRVVHILTQEMRELVSPVNTHSYYEMGTIFESVNTSTSFIPPQYHSTNTSTEGVLDRWTNFLQNLPQRFPEVDARSLLSYIGAVGSAVLRDITMAQCASFGTWWITKVWVDEMLLWLAEKGGFMQHSPSGRPVATNTAVNITHNLHMHMGPDHVLPLDSADIFAPSRPRTAASSHPDGSPFSSVDPGGAPTYQPQRRDSGVASQHVPMDAESQAALAAVAEFGTAQNHDDSGIGLGIDDEDMAMAKFGGFVADGVNVGSDPADVVVC